MKVLLLTMCFLGVTKGQLHDQYGRNDDVRRLLISWNRATFESITNQYYAAEEDKKKLRYADGLIQFEIFNGYGLGLLADTASRRFKFLAMLLSEMKSKEVFIVETNRICPVSCIRNYVVWRMKDSTVKVEYYFFSNTHEWLKESFTKTIPQADISLPISKYLVNASDGFNSEDVIISHFPADDTTGITSEFFSYGTISRKCAVKDM